jgi:hypothetical protein
MITGLKVTVGGEELVKLCSAQADYHANRAKIHEKAVASMADAGLSIANYSGGNPKAEVQSRVEYHQNAERELRFIAEHIDTAERYLLEHHDLETLGIRRLSRNRF